MGVEVDRDPDHARSADGRARGGGGPCLTRRRSTCAFTVNGQRRRSCACIRWRGCSMCSRRICTSPARRKAAARASAARAPCSSNGELVNSCLTPVLQADGATITTIEGVAPRTTTLHRRAAGVHRARRRAVRHLHAGDGARGGEPARAPSASDRRARFATGSPAICAAARATCGSSRRSSRAAASCDERVSSGATICARPTTLARGAGAAGRSRQAVAPVRRRHGPDGAARSRQAARGPLSRPVELAELRGIDDIGDARRALAR